MVLYRMPSLNPMMLQFLTVTLSRLSALTPSAVVVELLIVWPLQSSVTLSAPIVMHPPVVLMLFVRFVSWVMVFGQNSCAR